MARIKTDSTIKCCFGCKDRHAGCHGSCERYAAEKAAYEKGREEQRERLLREWDYQGFARESVERIRRRKRK